MGMKAASNVCFGITPYFNRSMDRTDLYSLV